MANTPAQITARILLETNSVLLQPDEPFTLTSGRKSPVYTDCRRLIAFPRARRRLMDMGAAMIEETVGFETLDVVAGGETAGIPFAAWMADRMALPMCYVRKKPKGFGRNARIEGALEEGQNVLLVEDLATDGGSKLSFVDGIREAGADCAHCFVVFHYGIFPEGVAALEKGGVKLHALCTWWDVLAEICEAGTFSADQIKAIRSFLDDPNGWAEDKG